MKNIDIKLDFHWNTLILVDIFYYYKCQKAKHASDNSTLSPLLRSIAWHRRVSISSVAPRKCWEQRGILIFIKTAVKVCAQMIFIFKLLHDLGNFPYFVLTLFKTVKIMFSLNIVWIWEIIKYFWYIIDINVKLFHATICCTLWKRISFNTLFGEKCI